MEVLPDFSLHYPHNLNEVLDLLKIHGDKAQILAGGTDLLLQMRHGIKKPDHLISLKYVDGLGGITKTSDAVILGSRVTHRQVQLETAKEPGMKALVEGARSVGSIQVRNVATVAGNICNGVPSADMAAPLLVLNATVVIAGPLGEREVPIRRFWKGPRETVVKPDELVTRISIPKPEEGGRSVYFKHARRKAMDLSIMGVAVYCKTDKLTATIEKACIALTTVGPIPMRAIAAEEYVIGKKAGLKIFQQAALLASQEASPRTSMRSTAEYRKKMIQVYLVRALTAVCQGSTI